MSKESEARRRRRHPNRMKDYYAANRERVRAQRHSYYLAHRAQAIAKQAEWRRLHPDYWREYITANRARMVHIQQRREARVRGAVGSHTLQEWRDKCALLGNVCIYCGEAKPLTRDHKIPLSRGGTDYIDNIVPACHSCNSRKRTMTTREFLAVTS